MILHKQKSIVQPSGTAAGHIYLKMENMTDKVQSACDLWSCQKRVISAGSHKSAKSKVTFPVINGTFLLLQQQLYSV